MCMKDFHIDDRYKVILTEINQTYKTHKEYWSKHFGDVDQKSSLLLSNELRNITEAANGIDNIGGYDGLVLSIVRKFHPKLLCKDLVSVQPIPVPTSMVFYYDPEITTATTNNNYQDMQEAHYDNEAYDVSKGVVTWITGATTALTAAQLISGSTAIVPYSGDVEGLTSLWFKKAGGAGVDLTSNISSGAAAFGTGLVNSPTLAFNNSLLDAAIASVDVNTYTAGTEISGTSTPVVGYTIYAGNFGVSTPTAWEFDGSGTSTWDVLDSQDIGAVDWTNGSSSSFTITNTTAYTAYRIRVTRSGDGTPAAGFGALAELAFHSGNTAAAETLKHSFTPQNWGNDLFSANQISVILNGSAAGDVNAIYKTYATLEAASAMQQVRLIITGTSVTAESRKIKLGLTEELAQDMESLFAMNAMDELVEMCSSELATEIDREVIRDLINIAPYKSEWNWDRNYIEYSGHSFFSGNTDIGINLSSITQHTHNQTLLTKIHEIDGIIRKANFYHGANWIVCSVEVGSIIESMLEYTPNKMRERNEEIDCYGKLSGKYKVYIDPYLPKEILLMGYKGQSDYEAGYIFAPYQPLHISEEVYNADTLFEWSKEMLSRNAKAIATNKKYGVIYCAFPTEFDPVNAI